MNFDYKKFYAGYRKAFGSLNSAQVAALDALLAAIGDDDSFQDERQIAYILATIKHETANTFEPIEEYGKGKGRPYGKRDSETGFAYFGRGFVQLTWRKNYEKLGDLLGVDLVFNPALALDPEIAWRITSEGMRKGLFTGKSLDDYITDDTCDYRGARRIINGLDKAELIAGYARSFERILKDSLELPVEAPESEKPSESLPEPEKAPDSPGKPPSNSLVAIEKPAPKGFISTISKKIGGVLGGSLTFDAVTDKASKAGALGFSPEFWKRVAVFAVLAGVIYLVYELVNYVMESKREKEITNNLIAANSTPENKVVLVDKDKVSEFKARGYSIVHR